MPVQAGIMSSFSSVEKKLSTTALSRQLRGLPMLELEMLLLY
jgi:hypothetical protein